MASTVRCMLACLAILSGVLPARGASQSRPNIVLVVIDTLRADRLGGAYGGARGLTPFIDELAARGTVFTSAYSTCSWTNPSVASLFTSRYPSQHRVQTYFSVLQPDEVTVAEVLRAAGYATGAFSGNPVIAPNHGFAQGYDVWRVHPRAVKLQGDRLTGKAIRWIDRTRREAPSKPIFLYLQYMEPHSPYRPRAEYRARFLTERRPGVSASEGLRKLDEQRYGELTDDEVAAIATLYDAEVAQVDAELRAAFAALQSRGILDDAIVVIAADHGEEFWDHDWIYHGSSLFNELVHVPLVIVTPRGAIPRGVVNENVSLVDVAPTLLGLLGLPAERRFEGRPLLPRAEGSPPADVLAELPVNVDTAELQRHAQALIRGSSKLVTRRERNGRLQPLVYDLAADPGERQPDPPSLVGRSAPLLERLRRHEVELARRAAPSSDHQPVDDEMKEKLRRLGYLQ
jgi:choline-sulfatase